MATSVSTSGFEASPSPSGRDAITGVSERREIPTMQLRQSYGALHRSCMLRTQAVFIGRWFASRRRRVKLRHLSSSSVAAEPAHGQTSFAGSGSDRSTPQSVPLFASIAPRRCRCTPTATADNEVRLVRCRDDACGLTSHPVSLAGHWSSRRGGRKGIAAAAMEMPRAGPGEARCRIVAPDFSQFSTLLLRAAMVRHPRLSRDRVTGAVLRTGRRRRAAVAVIISRVAGCRHRLSPNVRFRTWSTPGNTLAPLKPFRWSRRRTHIVYRGRSHQSAGDRGRSSTRASAG